MFWSRYSSFLKIKIFLILKYFLFVFCCWKCNFSRIFTTGGFCKDIHKGLRPTTCSFPRKSCFLKTVSTGLHLTWRCLIRIFGAPTTQAYIAAKYPANRSRVIFGEFYSSDVVFYLFPEYWAVPDTFRSVKNWVSQNSMRLCVSRCACLLYALSVQEAAQRPHVWGKVVADASQRWSFIKR